MELNHQIRFCRPFPFLFGFRAISYDIGNRTVFKQASQGSDQFNSSVLTAILLVESFLEGSDEKGSWRIANL